MTYQFYFGKNDVYIGASTVTEKDGFQFRIDIEYDDMMRIEDVDCYSQKEIKAWKEGKWCYGGIVVHAQKNGVNLGIVTSLWGIEIGDYFPQCALYVNDVIFEMLPEAVENAKKRVAEMLEKLSA